MLKNNPIEIIIENKKYIYPVLMIAAGLFVGVVLFRSANDNFYNGLSKLFAINNALFNTQLLSHFCLYFSAFTVTVLLGLCLIGFPILNIIPFIIGFQLAIKISYFYTAYTVKGIGYSVLMIIPEGTIFATILVLTIVKSNELSRNIYNIISKKSGITEEIDLKLYLKKFALYGLIIALICVLNTSLNYFLSAIISI